MSGGRGRNTFIKNQRERQKQQERLAKIARRLERNEQKREAKRKLGDDVPAAETGVSPEAGPPVDGGAL